MNLKYQEIIDVFTKFGASGLELWFSGKKKEGEYKNWDSNGQIVEHCFWKNGKLDGEYKTWYENGQVYEHGFWKNGKLDGELKRWYSNGQIRPFL